MAIQSNRKTGRKYLRGGKTRGRRPKRLATTARTSLDTRTGTVWEPFDLSPEEIARIAMQSPPRNVEDWKFLDGATTLPEEVIE